jgi:PAS domain S-box-containing protein
MFKRKQARAPVSRSSLMTQQQAALVRLAKESFSEQGHIDTVLNLITEISAQTLKVERVGVWLFNADQTILRCVSQYILSSASHGQGVELKASDFPKYFSALMQNRLVYADDARSHPDTSEFLTTYLIPYGITAMLDAPIRVGGEVVGVVCNEHVNQSHSWEPDEQNFAASIADFVAIAIERDKRKKAEDALKESERRYHQLLAEKLRLSDERYRALLEVAPTAVVILDKNGRTIFANPAAEALTGMNREEIGARKPNDAAWNILDTKGDPIPTDQRPFTQILTTKKPIHDAEISILGGKGERIAMSLSGVPIFDPDGEVDGVVFCAMDVTERRRAEALVRENEEKFRELTENIDEVFWMRDLATNQLLYISPAFEKVWGKTAQDLFKDPKCWLDVVHPEDRERIEKYLATIDPTQQDMEYRVVRPTGEVRWIHSRTFPIKNAKGEVYRITGIAEDVTYIKKSQHDLQLLANIVSMSVDAISTGNLEGNITSWNHSAEAIFGYKAEEVIGKDVRELLVPPERLEEAELTLKKNPSAVVRMRTERLHKSGKRIPVMMTTFPMLNEKGKVYARAGIHQDLTHLVEMERKLAETSRMATLGSMAAAIAHEIRNPLFGISAVAQILSREASHRPELKELGDSMLSEIERLNKMLKDLLLYSRPRRLEIAPTNVKLLFQEFLERQEALMKELDLTVDASFEPNEAEILVDPLQIRQVILNLCLNAFQASPPKKNITVRSKVMPEFGWLFTVHNYGDPISPANMTRIFDPFFSTKAEGSGLGLSICRKIIEDHEGTIDCNSSASDGTQFIVRIPLKGQLDGNP